MLCNFFHTVERLVNLARTFKDEGDGHNTYGKNAHSLCLASNNRRSTSTRTATHTSSDEHHLSTIVEHVLDALDTFFSCLTSACWTVARTKTFATQLQAHGDRRILKRLGVGITDDKVYVVDAFAVHIVYGVTTTATHTDDFNDRGSSSRHSQVYKSIFVHCFEC